MKTTAFNTRELVAWVVLACAILLFSVTVSFAQDKNRKQEKKSEIKIKIQKDENGKKTSIDTTITADQLPALREYLKEMNIDFDADADGWGSGSGNGSGRADVKMHFRHPEMSKEDREAFERDMEKLRDEMDNLDHELKDMHIEMYGFNDSDPENFDFHMEMPRIPDVPMPSANGFYFYDDDGSGAGCGQGNHFNFRFHSMNDDVPDSLNDENHIILYGAKGEDTPVLEKEITTSDGDKIFVFKRKLPKEEPPKATASMPVTKVKVYPNPGDGKISISFTAASKGDIEITITDPKGKEVYSKTLSAFSGEYFNEVDISGKGKGTYFLKITQGDDSITKKLVVE